MSHLLDKNHQDKREASTHSRKSRSPLITAFLDHSRTRDAQIGKAQRWMKDIQGLKRNSMYREVLEVLGEMTSSASCLYPSGRHCHLVLGRVMGDSPDARPLLGKEDSIYERVLSLTRKGPVVLQMTPDLTREMERLAAHSFPILCQAATLFCAPNSGYVLENGKFPTTSRLLGISLSPTQVLKRLEEFIGRTRSGEKEVIIDLQVKPKGQTLTVRRVAVEI